MARDDLTLAAVIDRRLIEWADWLRVGGSSAGAAGGYPGLNMLHKDWVPGGSGGQGGGAAIVARSDHERAVHQAVVGLTPKLLAAVVAVYVIKLAPDDRAAVLGCSPSAVRARVAEARRVLADAIGLRC